MLKLKLMHTITIYLYLRVLNAEIKTQWSGFLFFFFSHFIGSVFDSKSAASVN